jgi:hypothetical protein
MTTPNPSWAKADITLGAGIIIGNCAEGAITDCTEESIEFGTTLLVCVIPANEKEKTV